MSSVLVVVVSDSVLLGETYFEGSFSEISFQIATVQTSNQDMLMQKIINDKTNDVFCTANQHSHCVPNGRTHLGTYLSLNPTIVGLKHPRHKAIMYLNYQHTKAHANEKHPIQSQF